MDKQTRTYLLIFTLAAFGCGVLFIGASYALDPFQVYHASAWQRGKFLSNSRYQNAGLIARLLGDEKCCEALIMGSSFSQNYLGPDVSDVMGWKGTLNLSMDGSIPAEQTLVLEKALSTGQIKHVIWEIYPAYAAHEYVPFNKPEVIRADPWKYFPDYLYDANPLNDLRYLASTDVIGQSITRAFTGRKAERLYYWYDDVAGRFGHGADLRTKYNSPAEKSYMPSETFSFPTLDATVQTVLTAHPDIDFILILPPFSRLYYAVTSQAAFQREMDMRLALARLAQDHDNAALYAFDHWDADVENLDRYSDLQHHDAALNARIIRALRAGQGRITAQTAPGHIQDLTRRVNAYIARNFKDKES